MTFLRFVLYFSYSSLWSNLTGKWYVASIWGKVRLMLLMDRNVFDFDAYFLFLEEVLPLLCWLRLENVAGNVWLLSLPAPWQCWVTRDSPARAGAWHVTRERCDTESRCHTPQPSVVVAESRHLGTWHWDSLPPHLGRATVLPSPATRATCPCLVMCHVMSVF